jgi:hypothetical protein
MKFGRNQPRSQPIVRVARLEAIPMRVPSNPPLTSPALAQLDGPPRASSQEGKTTMSLMFLPTFRWKRVKAGCQRFYRRR